MIKRRKRLILLIAFVAFVVMILGGMKIYESTKAYRYDDNGNIRYYDGKGEDSFIYVTPGASFDYNVIEQDE